MAKQTLPTPPDVDGRELQDSFHQLLQHNVKNQYQANAYAGDSGADVAPGSSYNTPEPEAGQWYMDQYGNRAFMYHNQNHLAGDVQYVSKRRLNSHTNARLTKNRMLTGSQSIDPTKAICTRVCRNIM